MNAPNRAIPIWGILSITLILLTAAFSLLSAALLDQVLVRSTVIDASISTLLPGTARAAPAVILVSVVMSVIATALSFVTRERPHWLPILGVGITLLLIGLLIYFE
jgi:hypothetical protein